MTVCRVIVATVTKIQSSNRPEGNTLDRFLWGVIPVRISYFKPVMLHRLLFLVLIGSAMQPAFALEPTKPTGQREVSKLRMIGGNTGGMTIVGNSQLPLADRVANQFAPQFGIQNPAAQLRVKKSRVDNGLVLPQSAGPAAEGRRLHP